VTLSWEKIILRSMTISAAIWVGGGSTYLGTASSLTDTSQANKIAAASMSGAAMALARAG